MGRKALIVLILFSTLVVSFAEIGQAVPPWRRRRSRGNYSYSGGSVRIAPKLDRGTADYRRLRVYFDYDRAKEPEVAFHDRVRVFLTVHEEEIAGAADPLVAEVKISDVRDSQTTHVVRCPVTLTSDAEQQQPTAHFELTNEGRDEPLVQPGSVYRMFVSLHRDAETLDGESAWGRVAGPYYVATSGESRVEKARQQIVMRTFREWYYTERGWRRNAQYPMDCHAYYLWAAGSCTVGARNGRARLDRLFGGRHPYRGGGELAELTEQEPIHADYVRIPGHTFMLLEYDPQQKQVWTMEANFNSTIEVCIRSVSSGWTVGHLVDEHIDPEAVVPADSGEEAAELTAREPAGGSPSPGSVSRM